MYRVFVSHSSRDTATARAVVRWLTKEEPGLDGDIFLDVDPDTGIAPGTRWKAELVRAVDRCEAVICLISRAWEDSAECVAEFRHAEALNKRIFVARIDVEATARKTREWQFCDLFIDGTETVTIALDDGISVELAADGLRRLLRGLREAGIGAEHFPWPPPDEPGRTPYRGWQPMEDADAAVFFGRDPQILRGLDTIRGMRATGVEGLFVVLGPSGVGKSSFLRAGLLPRLRRDRNNFVVCNIIRPERAVVSGDHGLAQAIWRLRSAAHLHGPALGDIRAACVAGDAAQLATWLREAQREFRRDSGLPTLVLPIDQAEELFAADSGPEAAMFLTLLGALLRSDSLDGLPMMAVATIRADRYELLQGAAELSAVHTREFGDLKPMPTTEFKEVITGPAARATAAGLRLSLEPGLVAELLNDAASGADSLPLLALTLSRLYLDYGSTGNLTVANYRSMGGIQQIVNTEIATLLDPDDVAGSKQLDTLRSAFIPWLATVDPTTEQVLRRVARWDELPPESHVLIDAMVTRRLLVKDERGGNPVVEVALESLFRQWDSLAEWLREESENLKAVDNLDRAAADWERNQRSADWLIKGVRLAAAEQLATSPTFADRIGHAGEFLRASREREEAESHAELRQAQERRDDAEAHAAVLRKRGRVLRAVLAATLVVTLVAVGGLLYANSKRREAEEGRRNALAAQLTSQAQSILAGGQPGGIFEAITKILAAQDISSSPDRGAMLTALNRTARLRSIVDAPNGRFLSSDGSRIATTTGSGIQLLDTATGDRVGVPFGSDDTIYGSSPDGRYLALVNENDETRVWDSLTGQPIGDPVSISSAAPRFVSPDGRRMAFNTSDGIRLWDVATGQPIGRPIVIRGVIGGALAFSRDGRRLAASIDAATVALWDADSAAELGQPLNVGYAGAFSITKIAFSPDGHSVAGAVHSWLPNRQLPVLHLWNSDTGEAVGTGMFADYGFVLAMAFSPDGSRIVTGGNDKMVRLWDARTALPAGDPIALHDQVSDVAFSGRGNRIVAVSADTVQVYDGDPDATLLTETRASAVVRARDDLSIFWAQSTTDGPRLIVRENGGLRVLDADSGQEIGPPIDEYGSGVQQAELSPDDRWLAMWAGASDYIRVVDTTNGQPHGDPLTCDQSTVNAVKFSPDGQRIAIACDDKTIRLWDWPGGRQVGDPMLSGETADMEFSSDGHRLLAKIWNAAQAWDITTGAPIGKPVAATGSNRVAISPDGRRVTTITGEGASGPSAIEQWDLDSGTMIGTPMVGHTNSVDSVAYGPHGDYLVSAGSDRMLRFWDTSSGRQLGDAIITGENTSVKVSHDGRRILVNQGAVFADGDADGSGSRVLELPAPPEWRDQLCDKLPRNPTEEQWRQWVSPDIPYMQVCPR